MNQEIACQWTHEKKNRTEVFNAHEMNCGAQMVVVPAYLSTTEPFVA